MKAVLKMLDLNIEIEAYGTPEEITKFLLLPLKLQFQGVSKPSRKQVE